MAKTIASHNYVIVKDDTVISVFKGSDLPEYNEADINVIDVTKVTPLPALNWVYDSLTKKFSAPLVVPIEPLSPVQTLKNEFGESILSDIDYVGHTFNISIDTYSIMASYAAFASLTGKLPDNFYWLNKSNEKVHMTLDQFKGFCTVASNKVFNSFDEYVNKRNKI